MGGSSKPKAPAMPDYTALVTQQAAEQQRLLEMQTQANRPNQTNPLGSLNWSQDANGRWTQTETWSPEVTASNNQAQNLQNQQLSRLQDQGGFGGGPALPSYSGGGPALPSYDSGGGGGIPGYQNSMIERGKMPVYQGGGASGGGMPTYDAQTADNYSKMFAESLLSRMRPEQQQAQSSMATKLRLQGLQPGTGAYDRAYQNLLTSQGDANSQANLQGMMAGSQEARAMYESQLTGQNQAYTQSMGNSQLGLQQHQLQLDTQNQDFMQQLQQAGLSMDQYRTMLAGQGQEYSQGLQDYMANLQGQGQAHSQGLQDYMAGLQGQQQGFNQDLQRYMLPWETAGMAQGLANGTPRPNFPGYSQAGAGEAADVTGAAQQTYAQRMQAYNEAQQRRSGKGGAIGSVAGAIGGSLIGMPTLGAGIGNGVGSAFSDITLKEDIRELSDEECYLAMKKIVPISWRWTGTSIRDSGLSAQDVLEHAPHLVERAERGLLKINYSEFTAMLLGAFRHMVSKEAVNVDHAA